MMKNLIWILCLILFFSSCYYDNIDEIHPEAGLFENCDTTAVSFTKDIMPILDLYCGSNNNGCHSANHTGTQPSLFSYSSDSDFVVSPGGIDQLISSITQDGSISPMPKNGGKLSDCKINKIAAWINQGLAQ